MDGATSSEKGGIWIEKYRPRSLSEIVGQEAITSRLKGYVEKKDLPHLLFFGPCRSGKKRRALLRLLKKYMERNGRKISLSLMHLTRGESTLLGIE